MRVITYEDIKKINELYAELKTYAAVARATGFSPATVKKYVIKDYEVVEKEDIKRFEGNLPEFNPTMFRVDDWAALCVLSEEEINEIKELWKEIDV